MYLTEKVVNVILLLALKSALRVKWKFSFSFKIMNCKHT
uniref:Uncharacterized protein n=1 Tax=Anguilla anguilla TaxID=7936 RepID=A0A0E9V8D6_ANGAN